MEIDADTAVNYTLSTVAGYTPRLVTCNHCGAPHTDKGALAVVPHKVHICHTCKRKFRKRERAIGNKLALLEHKLPQYYRNRRRTVPTRKIRLDPEAQELRIWAANPAILWTAPRPEEEGIHVHIYRNGEKIVDETFGTVTINGRTVDPEAARILMAQKTYSLLIEDIKPRLQAITCPVCREPVLYAQEKAFKPTKTITCPHCGSTFKTPKAVIPQPLSWLKLYL